MNYTSNSTFEWTCIRCGFKNYNRNVCGSCGYNLAPETHKVEILNKNEIVNPYDREFISHMPTMMQLLGTNDLHVNYIHYEMEYCADPHLKDKILAEIPLNGLLTRLNRKLGKGVQTVEIGMNLCETKSFPPIKYIIYSNANPANNGTHMFRTVVPKGQLFRFKRHIMNQNKKYHYQVAPILKKGLLERIYENSVGFLLLKRKIKKYNVKIKKGIILDGDPGNGKTMFCRWIQYICKLKGIPTYTVTSPCLDKAYKDNLLSTLFDYPGVTFFDDIDVSYFNRRSGDGRMACALLTAMDGMDNTGNSVRFFTTNEEIGVLDDAFVRPGRIDCCFTFEKPDSDLRIEFACTWPKEILDNIYATAISTETEGFSFAEMDHLKTLLVSNYLSSQKWDLTKAMEDLKYLRSSFSSEKRKVGY